MNKIFSALRLLSLSAAMLLLAACQQGVQPDSQAAAADMQDIQDQQALWLKAFNAKDAAGVAAIYTNDARLLPPHAPIAAGQIAIDNYWSAQLAQSTGSMIRSTPETSVSGDYAYSMGVYTLLDSKGATLDDGKYLEIWKLDGQTWKLYRDMYNSNQAPQAPATAAPAAATH